jgi:dynactin 1
MNELSPGTRVEYKDGILAVVRYAGKTHFSSGQWIGLELEDDSGKNDGSVQDQRYFTCAPGHGMFVRPDAIARILEAPPSVTTGRMAERSANGAPARPRQSMMSAEAARKRQSLMGSAAARSTPGSGLSLRVSRQRYNLGKECY